MKFLDLVNLLSEQDTRVAAAPTPAPQTQEPSAPPIPVLPKEPNKVLTSGYEKAKQITIDCLTILKNAIDLGLNMEGVITPELEESIKTIEIPEAVTEDNIAVTIENIHEGVSTPIKSESPTEI